MTRKDYYKLLNLPPSATAEMITDAYRRLMRRYHPDVNPAPDAVQRAQDLNEAYEVLSDPRTRAIYDQQPSAPTTSRPLRLCPLDRWPLLQRSMAHQPVHACYSCHGCWIDPDSLQALYRHLGRPYPTLFSAPAGHLRAQAVGPWTCPVEGAPLRRIGYQGIEIDICAACRGLWLDAGELDRIVALRSRARGSAELLLSGLLEFALAPVELVGEVLEPVFDFIGFAADSILN